MGCQSRRKWRKYYNMQSDLLIVIPAYNEEENIENVVTYIRDNYGQYDYIIVNDGSRDRTAERYAEARAMNYLICLRIWDLQGAFQAGLKYAYMKGYSYAINLMRTDSTDRNLFWPCWTE